MLEQRKRSDKMQGIIIARVSKGEQSEEGHYSLDVQVKRLREYAKKKGVEIFKEFIIHKFVFFNILTPPCEVPKTIKGVPELYKSVTTAQFQLPNLAVSTSFIKGLNMFFFTPSCGAPIRFKKLSYMVSCPVPSVVINSSLRSPFKSPTVEFIRLLIKLAVIIN